MPDILFPAGRMVGGNLDKLFPRTNADGTPKLDRTGQPMMQCSFGVAIPKGAETDWKQTPWGQAIYAVGAAAHPQLVAIPAFSWKVTDGDSQIPNKRMKRPCDQPGHKGHWVLWFSQGWLPKKWLVANGTNTELTAVGAIVPGYYIEVFASVEGNKIKQGDTPGVYLNPIHVGLVGEGERIISEVDVATVGFGKSAAPADAKPVTAATPQFGAQPAGFPTLGAVSAVPGYPQNTSGAPASVPSATTFPSSAPAAPVVPNPAILQVPAPAPVRQMTVKAAGAPYEAFVAQGWTDDMLRQQGYML